MCSSPHSWRVNVCHFGMRDRFSTLEQMVPGAIGSWHLLVSAAPTNFTDVLATTANPVERGRAAVQSLVCPYIETSVQRLFREQQATALTKVDARGAAGSPRAVPVAESASPSRRARQAQAAPAAASLVTKGKQLAIGCEGADDEVVIVAPSAQPAVGSKRPRK